jgi:enoyl-CoA hydratase/carnithine racemase
MEYVQLGRPREHVAVLLLNRPERYNALSFQVVRELHDALAELERDLDSRVVVLTGAGRGFCSGADLKAGAENGAWEEGLGRVQHQVRVQQAYGDLVRHLRRIPQPLIAAVNGPAAGGGFSLALACDMRICTPAARFNCAFTRLGLGGAEMGTSYFLHRVVGASLAAELMFTGRFVEAEEALECGLVSRVVAESDLMETALGLAAEIVEHATPFGLRLTKEVIDLVQGGLSLEEALHLENRNQVLSVETEDFQATARQWASPGPRTFADR